MNHRLALHAGWKLAQRVENYSSDETERLKYAYAICFARDPSPEELDSAKRFLQAVRDTQGTAEGNIDKSREPWVRLCRSLLITNEFIYVE